MTDPMESVEAMKLALQQMSDLMKGGIATLTAEGWNEDQAREIVLAVFLSSFRKGQV